MSLVILLILVTIYGIYAWKPTVFGISLGLLFAIFIITGVNRGEATARIKAIRNYCTASARPFTAKYLNEWLSKKKASNQGQFGFMVPDAVDSLDYLEVENGTCTQVQHHPADLQACPTTQGRPKS